MNICVLIMVTESEPSLSNIQAMKDSFMKDVMSLKKDNKLANDYDFYTYAYAKELPDTPTGRFAVMNDSVDESVNCTDIRWTLDKENVYRTFEKTISTLAYISSISKVKDNSGMKSYDWYIRINISCVPNFKLIDRIISRLKKDVIYCNAINSIIIPGEYMNDLYPRGDFMMFHSSIVPDILSVAGQFMYKERDEYNKPSIDHVDDCLIGACLIKMYGQTYYEHLKMFKYNYYPNNEKNDNYKIDPLTISTRVKTNPPGVNYSGYSWEDNRYRRYDGIKMKRVQDVYMATEWKESPDDLYNKCIVDPSDPKSRPTPFVIMKNAPVALFYEYLRAKRK